MKAPRVSLDQWRALQAIVEQGGYAQAAAFLHRSQSSVSYAIGCLEAQLGTAVLMINGRKAELTETGRVLFERARKLLEDAGNLEQLATDLSSGQEAEIRLVVDAAFPFEILLQALRRFADHCPQTRIQLEQMILSGVDERLAAGLADLAISGQLPADMLGDEIITIEFMAVAHPRHPLHQLQSALTLDDLRDALQIVISDSGIEHKQDRGWLGASQQWSVSSLDASLQLISNGMGYGWLPRHLIGKELQHGTLKELPLREGKSYTISLYLVYGNPQHIGPATQLLADILKQCIQHQQMT